MALEPRFLEIKFSTSRGQDTYGYTLLSLYDCVTNKRFRTCGGGYDMVGTVLAEWMTYSLQKELLALLKRCGMKPGDYAHSGDEARAMGHPYGCGITKKGVAFMDGAVGQSSVEAMLRRLGYSVRCSFSSSRRNRVLNGFIINPL